MVGEHLHAARRCRGNVNRVAEVEVPGVDRMKAVDVLRRRDCSVTFVSFTWTGSGSWTRMPSTSSSLLRRSMSRGRRPRSCPQVSRRHEHRCPPRSPLVLGRDIHVRSGVVADENRCQADMAERGNVARDVRPHTSGELLSVHQHGRHAGDSIRLAAVADTATGSRPAPPLPISLAIRRFAPGPYQKACGHGPYQDCARRHRRHRDPRCVEAATLVRARRRHRPLHARRCPERRNRRMVEVPPEAS